MNGIIKNIPVRDGKMRDFCFIQDGKEQYFCHISEFKSDWRDLVDRVGNGPVNVEFTVEMTNKGTRAKNVIFSV